MVLICKFKVWGDLQDQTDLQIIVPVLLNIKFLCVKNGPKHHSFSW